MSKKKNIKSPAVPSAGGKKWLWIALAVVAVIVIAVVAWYLVRFQFYDAYKSYLTVHDEALEGMDFAAIADDEPMIPGMALYASNENMKLYVDASTGKAAVYDVRTDTSRYYVSLADAATFTTRRPRPSTRARRRPRAWRWWPRARS